MAVVDVWKNTARSNPYTDHTVRHLRRSRLTAGSLHATVILQQVAYIQQSSYSR